MKKAAAVGKQTVLIL